MPSTQSHIVAHHRLELAFESRKNPSRRADEMLVTCREQLATAIEECCEGLIGPNDYFTIPYLELDLGKLDPKDLSQDFISKFKAAFLEQLQDELKHNHRQTEGERALNVVKSYCETGNYPWWAGNASALPLLAAMENLLGESEGNNSNALRNMLRNPVAMQRLVMALPNDLRLRLWTKMLAQHGPMPAKAMLSRLTFAILQKAARLPHAQIQAFSLATMAYAIETSQKHPDLGSIWLWLQMEGPETLPIGLESCIHAGGPFVDVLDWLRKYLNASAEMMMQLFLFVAAQAPEIHLQAEKSLRNWLSKDWGLTSSEATEFLSELKGFGKSVSDTQAPKMDENASLDAFLERLGFGRMEFGAAGFQVLQAYQSHVENSNLSAEAAQNPQHVLAWAKEKYALKETDVPHFQAHFLALILANTKARKGDSAAAIVEKLQEVLHLPSGNLEQLCTRIWESKIEENLTNPKAILDWLCLTFPSAQNQIAKLAPLLEALLFQVKQAYNLHTESVLIPPKMAGDSAALQSPKQMLEWVQKNLRLEQFQTIQLLPFVAAFWQLFEAKTIKRKHNQLDLSGLWENVANQLRIFPANQSTILDVLWRQFREANPSQSFEKMNANRAVTFAAWQSWTMTKIALSAEAQNALVAAMELAFPEMHNTPKLASSQQSEFEQKCQALKQAFGMPNADQGALSLALWERFLADESPNSPYARKVMQWMNRHFEWPPKLIHQLANAVLKDNGIEEKIDLPNENLAATKQSSPIVEETIWIENAGLILLWPFFERMLGYQGLTEGKEFVSLEAIQAAVCLLQSIVDERENWNEAALVLPKILCGLNPEALIDPQTDLNSEAIEAAQQLIEVVLAYWTMAGEMQMESFRAAWLKRAGSLRRRDDHWLLRIEAHAQDILLEGLPWEIAYIQLPWMPFSIYVDWAEKAKFST